MQKKRKKKKKRRKKYEIKLKNELASQLPSQPMQPFAIVGNGIKPLGGLSAPWQAGDCAIQSERYKLQGKNLAGPI